MIAEPLPPEQTAPLDPPGSPDPDATAPDPSAPEVSDADAILTQHRLATCRRLMAEQRIIARHLGPDLCPSAHWTMLLDLYLAPWEERIIYQSCLAADAPPARSHRHALRLEALGAVDRRLDPADHRRMRVLLRPETIAALDNILDLIAASRTPAEKPVP